jgi:hypothetical protein
MLDNYSVCDATFNYSVCDATFNFSFILMGPALHSKLLQLNDDEQVVVIKPAGRVEDVSGP